MAALDTINPERGVAALTDEQLHALVDRLVVDDPDALAVARRLVGSQRHTSRQTNARMACWLRGAEVSPAAAAPAAPAHGEMPREGESGSTRGRRDE